MAILTSKGARAPHQLKGRRNIRISRDRRGSGTDDLEVLRNELLQVIENSKTPIGTIISYAGANAPQGYLLCQGQAVSKSEYAELYLVIGDLYSNDETAEGFFNVPDLRDRFIQGANGNLGIYKSAGLPNIIGTIGSNHDIASSGAFETIADHLKNSGADPFASNVYFNAARGETRKDGTLKTADEHHVYGASDTVQPPALCLYYFIKAKYL